MSSPIVLRASDPEPPIGSKVRDDLGQEWIRADNGYGDSYWLCISRDGDPESWVKIAGNYGPVIVVRMAADAQASHRPDLAEFLLARFIEDEAAARTLVVYGYAASGTYGQTKRDLGDAAASPSVLTNLEAKRRIVHLHRPDPQPDYDNGWGQIHDSAGKFLGYRDDICGADGCELPCETLRLLALPYSDHADYRPEWRPET